MAIKIYRVYHADNALPSNVGHLFSIVADNDRASYAIPVDEKITDFAGLNQGRIDALVGLEEKKPNTPEDWALVASQNMSMLDVIPTDEEYSSFEDAVEEESAKATDAWFLRNIEFVLPVTAAAAEACPPATTDIELNLKNRKNAIDTAMYGPLNPEEPNEEYWQTLANEWNVDIETAKQQRCGNCAVFVVTTEMKDCIKQGLTGGERSDEFDAIDAAGELGYCEAFDFKCASARTCRAWVAGGPVDDTKAKEQ